MGSPILILSMCLGNSTRMQRVNTSYLFQIKEMMANAQKMIQERKAQLQVNLPNQTIPDKPAQSPQVR